MKAKSIIILMCAFLGYAQDVPKEVWDVAYATLKTIPDYCSNDEGMGFPGTPSVSDLTLGKPFKWHHPNFEGFYNATGSSPVSEVLSEDFEWAFPVLEKGHMRVRFTVKLRDGKWERSALGAYLVMLEWAKIIKAWPESKGYHPVMLASSADGFFFHVPEYDAYNLTRIKIAFDRGKNLSKTSKKYYRKLSRYLEELKGNSAH